MFWVKYELFRIYLKSLPPMIERYFIKECALTNVEHEIYFGTWAFGIPRDE